MEPTPDRIARSTEPPEPREQHEPPDPPVPPDPPEIDGVLETVLYYGDEEGPAMERFYREILGMRLIGRKEGQFHFFRAGRSVFLLFDRQESARQESPPPHGSTGPGHTCFLVPRGRYEGWKTHLTRSGVEWSDEIAWPGGGRSFYLRDPAGNALEIADRDIWPE